MHDSTAPLNRLSRSASSYLRSARHQPVDWYPWGEDAFRRAQAENKPILLDIGAVWCHWCHVMDRESYEDPSLAAVLNEHFIAVKVDRDERPDVDARYQAAVSAISQQGGWPLTAFLTPDGRPFFGGTYFPPDERYGRPSFKRVLLTMADVWRTKPDEALESAASVMAAIEQNENFSGRGCELSLTLVEKIVASIVKQADLRNGGFGSQPKFPHPAALDLLLDAAMRTGNEEAEEAVLLTLEKMSKGGVYDQLAGGFHRYSVDERWVVPHFEKMLYDNTELLRCYVHAYQSYVKPEFAQVAREIVRWMQSVLADEHHGGFYASQDADISLDDDGDYFTWTRAEAVSVLADEEMRIAGRYWDIGELGDMHHNPQKNVLHIRYSIEDVAREAGIDVEAAAATLAEARRKLLAARLDRPTPFIDRTLYTGWNAMAVSAFLEAARVLRDDQARAFALRSLDRLLAEAWDGEKHLSHVIAYGEVPDGQLDASPVAGTLDDYTFTIHACLDAWASAGGAGYFTAAQAIADAMVRRFHDRAAEAFVDVALDDEPKQRLGALSARRKPLQDAPTPGGNPVAAAALLRLEQLTGRSEYREIAEDVLGSFAGIVEHFGLYVGTYALALLRLKLEPVQVVVVGEGIAASRLEAVAMARYAPNKTVIRLDPAQVNANTLPPALAETLAQLPAARAQETLQETFALVCLGSRCLPPVHTPDELLVALGLS